MPCYEITGAPCSAAFEAAICICRRTRMPSETIKLTKIRQAPFASTRDAYAFALSLVCWPVVRSRGWETGAVTIRASNRTMRIANVGATFA